MVKLIIYGLRRKYYFNCLNKISYLNCMPAKIIYTIFKCIEF